MRDEQRESSIETERNINSLEQIIAEKEEQMTDDEVFRENLEAFAQACGDEMSYNDRQKHLNQKEDQTIEEGITENEVQTMEQIIAEREIQRQAVRSDTSK